MSTILPATSAPAYPVPIHSGQPADFGEPPLRLQSPVFKSWSPDEFLEFSVSNPNLRIERSANGDLIVMAPAAMESGDWNAEITMQLRLWAKKDGTGKVFDSSSGFTLPNGAILSPDTSWIEMAKWNRLTKAEKGKYGPFCPDFVLELRSPSDRLVDLQAKLAEFLANGARLGWLIDPYTKTVHVYRPGQAPEILLQPQKISGEAVLPGFELDLREIFSAG
jgi:Uma2 family endonuclease